MTTIKKNTLDTDGIDMLVIATECARIFVVDVSVRVVKNAELYLHLIQCADIQASVFLSAANRCRASALTHVRLARR